jgi:hypothetical protein
MPRSRTARWPRQYQWWGFDWHTTCTCQESGGFEPVAVAASFVAGDVPPELSECHSVLADQLAGGFGKALGSTARVAGDTLWEAS